MTAPQSNFLSAFSRQEIFWNIFTFFYHVCGWYIAVKYREQTSSIDLESVDRFRKCWIDKVCYQSDDYHTGVFKETAKYSGVSPHQSNTSLSSNSEEERTEQKILLSMIKYIFNMIEQTSSICNTCLSSKQWRSQRLF